MLVIGFITDIFNHRQFLGLHLSSDLLLNATAGHLIGQLRDDDLAIFHFIDGTSTDRTSARFVDVANLFLRRNDSAPVGKSGPLMCLQSSASVESGSSSSLIHAVTTSRRLCGGTSVAIPTAMPV